MVLPLLGLAGMALLGGSTAKAIAGGAGEQYADLYQDTMKEKLDYMKRKRLMEESNKLSRQGKLMDDKEANEKARQQLQNTVKKQIGTLETLGYSRQNASMIVANGTDSYNTAKSFAGNLKSVDGVLPDPDTFYTTFTGDVALSGKDQEKINAISKGEWTEMAVNSLDASYTGAGVSPYRIVMTKKPTDKEKKTNISTSNLLGNLTNSLLHAKNKGTTDQYYNDMFKIDSSIELKFKSNGEPENEETKKVINNIKNSIDEVRRISGTTNKDKDYSKTEVGTSVLQNAFDRPLQWMLDHYKTGESSTSIYQGYAGDFKFKDDTPNNILKSMTALYSVYNNVQEVYYGKGTTEVAMEQTKAPDFRSKVRLFEESIQGYERMYLASENIPQNLVRQEDSIVYNNQDIDSTKEQLINFVRSMDQSNTTLEKGTIIKSKEGIAVAIVLFDGTIIDTLD